MSEFKVYTDGASRGNPGPSSIGVSICDAKGTEVDVISEYIGTKTNNQAEYMAVLEAFKFLNKKKARSFSLYSDSQLLIRQLTGVYRVKNPELKIIFNEIKELSSEFESIDYIHVPREENRRADALANEALDLR